MLSLFGTVFASLQKKGYVDYLKRMVELATEPWSFTVEGEELIRLERLHQMFREMLSDVSDSSLLADAFVFSVLLLATGHFPKTYARGVVHRDSHDTRARFESWFRRDASVQIGGLVFFLNDPNRHGLSNLPGYETHCSFGVTEVTKKKTWDVVVVLMHFLLHLSHIANVNRGHSHSAAELR